MKTLRSLALTSTGLAYVLVVLGGVVRITGAGMGCGDDWPLCNGRLIPRFDDAKTLLEWSHRMVALALTALVVWTAAVAVLERRATGGHGRGGTLRPALWALTLLALQVALGAITVALELPAASVILHLAVAMALMAALLMTALRATDDSLREPATRGRGSILGAVALAGVVILLGGLTANLGAGPSCQGFPLCNGQVWPASGGSGLPHIHWTHRIFAYALLLHMVGIGIGLTRRKTAERLSEVLYIAVGLTFAQVVVAAVMVLTFLPPVWRALHLAVGGALWIVLVYAAWLASGKSERLVA